MKLFTKIVYSSLLFCTLRVNPAFSFCANEPKSLKMLDEILLESKRSHSFFSYCCYPPLNRRSQSETRENTCSTESNPLRQKLWYLLHDLENERECTFDELEWNRIKDNIIAKEGKRVTKEDEADVYIIPNFLTQEQCEELVKIYEEISKSVTTK